jgi:hypothetical protein
MEARPFELKADYLPSGDQPHCRNVRIVLSRPNFRERDL